MKGHIIDRYPSSASNGGKRAECGGVKEAKELPYSSPQGPKHIMDTGVGLRGGTNHGNCGTQAKR